MSETKRPKQSQSTATQLLVNVVLPTIVLLGFSSESKLGPTKAMLLALAFPVVLELYTLSQRRKPSMLSIISIIGILVTGAIALLGLSENWLAVRRSAFYLVAALAIVISMLVKRSLVHIGLPYIIDMQLVRAKAEQKHNWRALQKRIDATSYALVILLLLIAISSYILTLVVINSPTDTAAFNNEYVRLRVLSLPATTLPLFVGIIGLLMYLLTGIEKLTGLNAEQLVRKKK